ncbi:MAG TPA: UbiH/UbiF/VisC/COQ6 family ubiquinone biosynthesis hydroxylase [Candidatus Thiothrix moscowensis]|uniref:UbiH/UbiF/VisC/COQ6 family ubiquinone biosynthesis hydroxylase n=1 Tax=unclassified Thiothrix TaxID=2636184 RepID=UPI0025EE9A9A|nr:MULTISPECIES: UbiH/UbiF/VisC/COQ6 family ubiquinone biosynthesis hydroxylase [unclassified Thiothrix]HRJ54177.1 UbiH/UbiF/VisC/COQ6 family ubiquinone biosynthesis hydroxylase [Candidatus Thiothrix moscowensis]HRJ94331.1 UbiH/UbiF/VisC/COQ6 family ubiquinone biosynthesis hydroxylase [Candidatus Thiothrix moscowensis]
MQYDVIIAGGGMVGSTLACLLGKSGKRVAVLEAHQPPPFSSSGPYDLRVSAISRASQRALAEAGAWEGVAARRSCAYEAMQVWDATGDGQIRFDAADIGEPDLGHIVENRIIQLALLDAIQKLDNVDLYCPDKLAGFAVDDNAVTVTLHSGTSLQGQLLVGADGAQSRVRQLAGIGLDINDYGQKGLVCVVQTELPHQETAWQRFMPSGPLAFLPLGDGSCSIVWTLPADRADALVQRDEADFRRELAQALDRRLGEITAVGERAAFSLRGRHAEPYIQERVALVGDAAHTIHPLAGQGVNLGIKDAVGLARQLQAIHGDVGSVKVLRAYERARRGDNILTQKAMEGFRLLFGNTLTPWKILRNAGLNVVDRMEFLKYQIAKQAMGI